jgi:hypothetical protein
MASFIRNSMNADEFMRLYMAQWRLDCDSQWEEVRAGRVTKREELELGKVLDQAFTACDCYSPVPAASLDKSAMQLQSEIAELFCLRWPNA